MNNTLQKTGKSLVFTIAFNGYQFVYRKNIQSHKRYAQKYGFDHAVINRPGFTSLLMECCWLKVILLMSALKSGYDWVFFIDADAEIKNICPDFRNLEKKDKALYMANGFTGRVNSGVIIVKNTPEMYEFFKLTLQQYNKMLPAEDSVGWGENGHIIHFSRNMAMLENIPPLWNNNHTPELNDYVRHYSAGPMRPLEKLGLISRLVGKISRYIQRFLQKTGIYTYSSQRLPERLMVLYKSSLASYSSKFKDLSGENIFKD
jgi:hypothetical protein